VARLLVASPVRQVPEVLREFLHSLSELDTSGFQTSYCFVDDNDNPESQALLAQFAEQHDCLLIPGHQKGAAYQRGTATHAWPEEAMWRVAAYKDRMIEVALDRGCDAMFFVDSDLVLHPRTLQQLWSAEKDIISEVFWTRWQPDQPELPQVWQSGHYDFSREFVEQLRWCGVYRVGGLGACTLVRARALQAGVRFEQVPGLAFWGEDRHFCARAAALGFGLYVDTHYPAYHIYRDAELPGVAPYRRGYSRRQVEAEIALSARRALEEWGTSHWKSVTGLEGLDRLAPELREAELQRRDEKVRSARERQTVSCTRVTGVRIEAADVALGVAAVTCTLINEGVDNGEPFLDELSATAVMVLEEGRWLVADVRFFSLEGEGSMRRRIAFLSSRARELLEQGSAPEARDLLLRHSGYLMKEPDLLAVLANALLAEGRYTDARQLLLQVLNELPDHPGLLCSLARLLEQGGRHSAAWKLYNIAARSSAHAGMARARQAAMRERSAAPQATQGTRKKTISLVYDSYSGSNTVALYKLTPPEVRERYELKLVRSSLEFSKRLETLESDLVVTTHGYFPLDPDQLNLDLWHGFPLKAMGLLDKQEDHARFGGHWRHTTKIASYSTLFNTLMNACIGKTINHYVVTGAPRNDFLFVANGRKNLSAVLGEPVEDQRVVLFVPTFRLRPGAQDGAEPWDNFRALGLDDEEFERFLRENNILFLLKLHPVEERCVLDRLGAVPQSNIKVLRGSELDRQQMDLYELLNAVDVLVTDYSSIYFDFLLLDRPIVFFVPDCEEYRELRGFLLEPYDFWAPGPKVVDRREFQHVLLSALSDPVAYHAQREQVASLVHQYRDGAATERVWRTIEKMLGFAADFTGQQ